MVVSTTEFVTPEVELATACFSPDRINISVSKAVETPGTIKVTPNTTLNQALITAGGFKASRAKCSSVDRIWLNIDRTSQQAVAINLAPGVIDKINPILREDDIIVVSRFGKTQIVDRLGWLLPAASLFTVLSILGIR